MSREMLLKLSFIFSVIFISFCESTGQVTFTCGGEADIVGVTQGMKGAKGEPGESDEWMAAQNRMQQQIDELQNTLSAVTDNIDASRRAVLGNRNCVDLLEEGFTLSGTYLIGTGEKVANVFCDMETDGGGWLVFQRRFDGSVDFYKDWATYQKGFGSLFGEFWLGLDNLHKITSSGNYKLRVDMEDFENNRAYAEYSTFSIGSEATNYSLTYGSFTGGDAGDTLSSGGHRDQPFSTQDMDHDLHSVNCAIHWHGAWWYNKCHEANLNGEYLHGGMITPRGITWHSWKKSFYSLKRVEMKIKPN